MNIVPDINIIGVLPESILTVVGLMLLMFTRKLKDRTDILAGMAATGLSGAMVLLVTFGGKMPVSFGGMFMDNTYTLYLNVAVLAASIFVVAISTVHLPEKYSENMGEYYACIVFSTIGMMFLVSATDLILIYVGLELMAISIYILTCFAVDRDDSVEAALKYFLLGAFASAITLYGITFIYGVAGTTNIKDIAHYFMGQSAPVSKMAIAGIILITSGFGFKVAMVPFHMWTPDVYEGAPTAVTAFMSVGPKIACIAAMVQIFAIALYPLREHWLFLMWVCAALTMTLGNVVALVQDNVKRLLAYSGIAHVGYMLMAFAAIAAGHGDSRSIAVSSILFYLFSYVAMNIGAFTMVILLAKGINEGEDISAFRGLYKRCPQAALMMAVFLLSLAGVPPMVGFVGKFWIFAATIGSELYWLAVIGVINAVISLYYYLRIVVAMYFTEPDEDAAAVEMPPVIYYASLAMVAITLFIGVFPQVALDFAKKSFTVIL